MHIFVINNYVNHFDFAYKIGTDGLRKIQK